MIVDKLIITVDIPFNERAGVLDRMKDAGKAVGKGVSAVHRKSGSRYQYLLKIAVNKENVDHLWADKSGDSTLRIDADPRGEGYNFMRFEWNPSKSCPIAVLCAIEHFVCPLWTYDYVLKNARINRIDLAIDVNNVNIDQMYVHSARKSMTRMIFTNSSSKGGKTEYLGQAKSEKMFRIYDKAAELKKKNLKKIAEFKEEALEDNITRIELELKPNKRGSLFELNEMSNPFADLTIYSYPMDLLNDDLFGQLLARARYEGLTKTLKSLSPLNRKKYTAIMKNSSVDWWFPEQIWSQVPNVLEKLIYPLEHMEDTES